MGKITVGSELFHVSSKASAITRQKNKMCRNGARSFSSRLVFLDARVGRAKCFISADKVARRQI